MTTGLIALAVIVGIPFAGLFTYFWAGYMPANYRRRFLVYRTLVRYKGFDFGNPQEDIRGSANIFWFAFRESTEGHKDRVIENSIEHFRIVDQRTGETVFDSSKS